MLTEQEEKFLSTKQEPLKLSIALTRFFEVTSEEWKSRYGDYLKRRFRAAIHALILEGNLSKIEILCAYGWHTESMLQEFIETAGKQNQTEIFLYFLNLKRHQNHADSQQTAIQLSPENPDTLCEEILTQTSNQICLQYPFFTHTLHSFTFKANNEQSLLPGTDGVHLLYHPKTLILLYREHPDRLMRILLHAMYHRLYFHLLISPKENLRLWNLACDIAVEHLIQKKTSKVYDAEQIYHILEEKDLSDERIAALEEAYHADEHIYWKDADASALLDSLTDEWSFLSRTSGYGTGGQSGGIGAVHGLQEESMTLRQKQKYDFRRYLKRFAVSHEELQTDMDSLDYIPYLYGLSHYGNMPLIEHPEQKEMKKLEELVIAIDTSSSCSLETVRRFMEETYGILSNQENFFKKMNVYILQCDCYIQHEAHITCEEDWKEYMEHLKIHGRSGTDFRPVFRHIEELRQKKLLKNLKALLYFTDGDGIYPQTPVDYETAFIFYKEKENHQKVPSWATTLILDDTEEK